MSFAIPFNLRTKLFLAFALSSTLLLGCLSLWSYHTARQAVYAQSHQVMLSALEQDVYAANANLQHIERTLDLLCNDADVQRYFQRSFNTADEEYEQSMRMLRRADALLRGMAGSVRLTMIGDHPKLHEIVPVDFENRYALSGFADAGLSAHGQVDVAVYRGERFAGEDWPSAAQPHRPQWMRTDADRAAGTVSLVQSLTRSDPSEATGALKLTLGADPLFPNLNAQDSSAPYRTFVLCDGELMTCAPGAQDEWRALVARVPELRRDANGAVRQLDRRMLYTRQLNNGWQVTRVYEFEAVSRLSLLRVQCVALLALSLAVSFALSYWIATHFSARIRAIGQAVSRFSLGELNVRAPDQGDAELNELAQGFNTMAGRIQSLIRDVYQAQIARQTEHLSMLQSQIRPHFLYNSLSAIVRLSERGDLDAIHRIALALVRFYRISLSKGREQILLRDEIAHVRAYLEVCAIRYKDRFTCSIQVSPQSELCYVPRIILQPFVENSLEHGLPDDETLHIRLEAEVCGGALMISIADDGVGVDEDTLRQLELDRQSPESGYGIRNVRQRIALLFGPSWGVRLYRVAPHGLRAALSMPAFTHPLPDRGQPAE